MTVQVTVLENGLRVATDTMPDAESVVVGAWVGVGTRHEPWKANGVAHLVEHMMFKGTSTRSAYALSAEIENKGGGMNAHTSREETAYYARVLPEETERATDIIADMLSHSKFDPRELDRERKVIIQEIGRDMDSPEDVAYDLLYAKALPKQKIGRPILGTADVIANLPRREVMDYVKTHYTAANMVMIAAGKIKHADFVAMVKKHFARLAKGKKPVQEKARISSGPQLTTKETEQVHLLMAFGGPSYHDKPRYYPTQLLSLILGGTSSSRLFQKVREKRGLVYTVSSSHSGFSDAGLFQIYAGTDPKRLRELVPVICDELRDVQKNIKPGELARAKAQIRADILMGKENVMRRAEVLGHQMLAYGKPMASDIALKKLMAVEPDDVMKQARVIFSKKPVIAALGPLEELEQYNKIVARLAG